MCAEWVIILYMTRSNKPDSWFQIHISDFKVGLIMQDDLTWALEKWWYPEGDQFKHVTMKIQEKPNTDLNEVISW